MVKEITYLSADSIHTNENRKEAGKGDIKSLADSIRAVGLINPITVTKAKDGYDIVAGRRRFEAGRMLGWTMFPCIVDDFDPAAIALVENSARLEMDPLDEGIYFAGEIKKGVPVKELAAKSCRKVSQVYQRAKLANLVPELRTAWKEGRIKLHVAALAAELPAEAQKRLYASSGEIEEWTLEAVRPAEMKVCSLSRIASCKLCAECSSRTFHSDNTLFPELVYLRDDYCLDPSCYSRQWKKSLENEYDKYLSTAGDAPQEIYFTGPVPDGLTLYGIPARPIDSRTFLCKKPGNGLPESLYRKVTVLDREGKFCTELAADRDELAAAEAERRQRENPPAVSVGDPAPDVSGGQYADIPWTESSVPDADMDGLLARALAEADPGDRLLYTLALAVLANNYHLDAWCPDEDGFKYPPMSSIIDPCCWFLNYNAQGLRELLWKALANIACPAYGNTDRDQDWDRLLDGTATMESLRKRAAELRKQEG